VHRLNQRSKRSVISSLAYTAHRCPLRCNCNLMAAQVVLCFNYEALNAPANKFNTTLQQPHLDSVS